MSFFNAEVITVLWLEAGQSWMDRGGLWPKLYGPMHVLQLACKIKRP